MNRYVMHVVHTAIDDRWHLQHEDTALGSFSTKMVAETAGEERGNKLWADGRSAQLLVHRKDGSVEHEYTYGEDSERQPG